MTDTGAVGHQMLKNKLWWSNGFGLSKTRRETLDRFKNIANDLETLIRLNYVFMRQQLRLILWAIQNIAICVNKRICKNANKKNWLENRQ